MLKKLFILFIGALTFLIYWNFKSFQISPLGTLAYIQNGNLWIKDVEGGKPQQLTHEQNICCPHWSSSGKYILYLKGEERWIIDRYSKKGNKIGDRNTVHNLEWSPKEDLFAYTDKKGALFVQKPFSLLPPKKLVSEYGNSYGSFVWSKDGKNIFYEQTDSYHFEIDPPKTNVHITRVDWRTGIKTTLLDESSLGLTLIDISPNSKYLVAEGNQFSASLRADGTSFSILNLSTIPISYIDTNSDHLATTKGPLVFSADSKYLLVGSGNFRETWFGKGIVSINLQNGEVKDLTSKEDSSLWANWSRDSTKIAYSGTSVSIKQYKGQEALEAIINRRIWTMDISGLNRTQLTNNKSYRDEFPQWSKDGNYILFARVNKENTKGSVWLMKNNGKELIPIVEELGPPTGYDDWFGYYGGVAWSTYFDWWQKK